ncbi:MAG: hypothetical protein AAB131_19410, partial [Actinomycetota bacterium]
MSRIRSTTRRRVMAVLALIMVAGSVDLDVGPAAARDVLPQPIGVIVGLVPGESIEADINGGPAPDAQGDFLMGGLFPP